MPSRFPLRLLMVALLVGGVSTAWAAERVLLTNGFSIDCVHRSSPENGRVKLFLDSGEGNFIEVGAGQIASAQAMADAAAPPASAPPIAPASAQLSAAPAAETPSLGTLIAKAGRARNIDAALLESVVQAESGGHARAVSRAGAQGLMQLMPATARSLGVQDSFVPEQNLAGGSAYLDQLLLRYHDNIALAVAAYNAGPGAVDRYHGIPPYRETQLYVARIIREFNRRVLEQRARLAAAAHP